MAPGATSVPLAGLDEQQIKRAAASLKKFVGNHKQESNNLLEDDDDLLYLQISLKKMPQQPRKDKPVPLEIPHPLYDLEKSDICLLVKDVNGEGHKAAKSKLKAVKESLGVTKVVGVSKLKTKYESHEAKRQLCNSFDLFLADESIVPSLPKLIGKSFFKKKKQPVSVNLQAKDWVAQIRKACNCTYLFKSGGTCMNIKVALSSFESTHVVENVVAVLNQAIKHIPKGWSNVQGVFLKTAESVALPVYQSLPTSSAIAV